LKKYLQKETKKVDFEMVIVRAADTYLHSLRTQYDDCSLSQLYLDYIPTLISV